MRPHHVLDDMKRVVADYPQAVSDYFDIDVWQVSAALLKGAVTFDFGPYAPPMVHRDFGIELLDRGLFQLPAPMTWFTGETLGKSIGLCAVPVLTEGDAQAGFDLLACARVEVGKGAYLLPWALCRVTRRPDLSDLKQGVCIQPIYMTNRMKLRDADGIHEDDDHLRDRLTFFVAWAVGAVPMLTSKDTTLDKRPASTRINEIRAARKRARIGDDYMIRIAPGVAMHYRRTAQQAEADVTASPRRPHFRRGHLRHYQNGLVMTLSPTFVGARPGETPIVRDYAVEG